MWVAVEQDTPSASASFQASIFQGKVNLQGRGTAGDSRWQGYPLTVVLHSGSCNNPVATYNATTDASDNFTITGMPSGTSYVRVKNAHTVSNCRANVVVPSAGVVDLGTMLEGDANNDDKINIIDFSVLRGGFGKCLGVAGWDPRPDFNGDGCINIRDFSLLRTNFTKQGPITLSDAQDALGSVSQNEANLGLTPPVQGVSVGQIFTMTLSVQADGQPVDGTDAVIGFDPQYLRVVDANGQEVNEIEAGTELEIVLRNVVDNQNGRIEYSAGQLEGDPPVGSFDLALVRFKLIAEPPVATEIEYLTGTDVVYMGESVLGQLQSGVVFVVDNKTYLPQVGK